MWLKALPTYSTEATLVQLWIIEASGLLFPINNIRQQYKTCHTSLRDDVR